MKKNVEHTTANTVDAYLQAQKEDVAAVLTQVRNAILKAAPKAEELISYQIPTYKYKGPLVHFAAFKNHCSFFGVSKTVFKKFEKELADFNIANTTIHFTVDNPLPASLVQKMVKERIKENEILYAMKQTNAK